MAHITAVQSAAQLSINHSVKLSCVQPYHVPTDKATQLHAGIVIDIWDEAENATLRNGDTCDARIKGKPDSQQGTAAE